jgi:predicted dehydrogenase
MSANQDPLRVALIGTGNRAQTIYAPLFTALEPWVKLVAVCDPVAQNANALAEKLNVPAYHSLRKLVDDRPMQAALVVTPIDSHHSISCFLSQNGIHNLVETTMASTLVQGRQMVATAKKHNVELRIAENFFRYPFDRMAKLIADSDVLGPIKRLTCFHDHLGYHNSSRWIHFFGNAPESVQAIRHTMPTAPHRQGGQYAHRYHRDEKFEARFLRFPDGVLVSDIAGNIKGMLGRYPRPGYTEFDGARGTIVQYATANWRGVGEVRYCSDEALLGGGVHDHVFPIEHHSKDGVWSSSTVDLPTGKLEYVNQFSNAKLDHNRDFYGAAVMGHIVDFAQAVQGVAVSEYSADDALMAMMIESGARLSARRDGAIIHLPMDGEDEADQVELADLRARHGVDPLDIEAMLAISYPRP